MGAVFELLHGAEIALVPAICTHWRGGRRYGPDRRRIGVARRRVSRLDRNLARDAASSRVAVQATRQASDDRNGPKKRSGLGAIFFLVQIHITGGPMRCESNSSFWRL